MRDVYRIKTFVSLFLSTFAMGIIPVAGAAEEETRSEGLAFFESRIRPVLAEHCYECHSAEGKRKAGLQLDSRHGWMTGGDSGPAIVPGKPAESMLLHGVSYEDPDFQMPPKTRLPKAVIEDLRQWIAMGAPDPRDAEPGNLTVTEFDLWERARRWCFQPVEDPEPPEVAMGDWPRDPIDTFILKRLEREGLAPAPEADRATLARRLHFDLTGLPPAPEELEAFLGDDRPGAYARLVDRLLASPHFGERWARHWMDLVRYAESHGHEFDYPIQNAHLYRDYLIRAFNADLPYDQFVREHIAGDLIEAPRRDPETGLNESAIATAHYGLGEDVHSPVDIKGHESNRIDNMIDVVGKAFSGMTVSCARCHDHMFDAISTKDYYAAYGMIESSRLTRTVANDLEVERDHRQLAELKTAIREEAAQAALRKLDTRGEYLLAAARVLSGKVELPDTGPRADIVVEDFEGGAFDGWQREGDAFGDRFLKGSELADYQHNVGYTGDWLVNSHNVPGDPVQHSDSFTGTLTSPPFRIERDFITFLVGGGEHSGRTCVNLLVGGEIARTATGRSNNTMSPHTWDVSDLAGQEARIQIVDQERGGWGNIGVDEIAQTNNPQGGEQISHSLAARVEAERLGLDPAKLENWVNALDASKEPGSSAHLWHALAKAAVEQPAALAAAWETTQQDVADARELAANPVGQRVKVLANYAVDPVCDNFFDGLAFSSPQEAAGEFVVGADGLQILSPAAHAGALGPKTPGTLRTQDFIIDRDLLAVRAKGTNGTIRVVINNMQIIRSPIYGPLRVDINSEDYRWFRFDVARWKGLRAYIEITNGPYSDVAYHPERAERVSVAQIVAADGGMPEMRLAPLAELSADHAPASAEELAGLFEDKLGEALSNWRASKASLDQAALLAWLSGHGLLDFGSEPLDALLKEYRALQRKAPNPVVLPGMTEGTPMSSRVFIRGDHGRRGDPVPLRYLEVLEGKSVEDTQVEGTGRAHLADLLADPQNPLTARVMVNRLWHHLLGRGIVPTVDNFGMLGEEPSHPQLLDHLATRFVEEDWSMKAIIRAIVLSSTYRMGADAHPDALAQDPNNTLFHSARTRRLTAEAIRDNILAVSGRLDRRMFGPSVAVHLTPFMDGRGKPGSGPLDGGGRRSIYLAVRRNFISPFMLAFDAPSPFSTFGDRNVTNVPAQSLTLMNDPFVVQQAEHWARELLRETALPDERVRRMYLKAFSRPPSERENALALEFLEDQAREHGLKQEEGTNDIRPWTDLCHALFNAKEFIYLF